MPSGKSGRYEYLVDDEWLPRGKVPFPEVSLDRFRKKVPDWKIKSGKPEEEAGGQHEKDQEDEADEEDEAEEPWSLSRASAITARNGSRLFIRKLILLPLMKNGGQQCPKSMMESQLLVL